MRTVDPAAWVQGAVPALRARTQTDADPETRLRRSLRDAAREFLRHASLRGALITNRRCRTTCDSARNFLGCTAAFVMAIFLVTFDLRQQISRPPLQVNVATEYSHSITKLRYPGIALCSNNVISKKALREYLRFIIPEGAHNRTNGSDIVMNNILSFGAFLSNAMPRVDLDHSLFDNQNFNVTDLMYQLSPKCEALLQSCAWEGAQRACAELFATRVTPLGFCCVFNSRYQPEDLNASTWSSDRVGLGTGVTVIYKEDEEDAAYVRRPALGVEVLLFDGDEYPLLESGAARRYPVRRNASMFLPLTQSHIGTSDDLTSYTDRFRQCRIRELRGPRSGRSSRGWCLLQCRRRATAALCNCVPFTLLPERGDVVCTTKHLHCLNKHKEKFTYYYPGDDAGPGLTEEMEDSLFCPECLPDCGRNVFSADVAFVSYSFSYERKLVNGLSTFQQRIVLANSSVLRFYYNTHHQPRFVVEPALRWYEGLAYMACHWVLLLTISLVTMVELIFHLTVRWVHHFVRRTMIVRTHIKVLKSSSSNSEDSENVNIDYLKETAHSEKNVNDSQYNNPPVDRFYFLIH